MSARPAHHRPHSSPNGKQRQVRSTNRPPNATEQDRAESRGGQRLQKVLAQAGIASRRDCEELIREGRVEVDRKVVTELGTRVDPLTQDIRVDGESLGRPKLVYFAVNKPTSVVCTAS